MVNNDGGVLLDQYVRPAEKVTDYRTFVSGIEPAHLKEGAVSLAEAQQKVAQILTGRVLVGHAVHHDLQVRSNFIHLAIVGETADCGEARCRDAAAVAPCPICCYHSNQHSAPVRISSRVSLLQAVFAHIYANSSRCVSLFVTQECQLFLRHESSAEAAFFHVYLLCIC